MTASLLYIAGVLTGETIARPDPLTALFALFFALSWRSAVELDKRHLAVAARWNLLAGLTLIPLAVIAILRLT